MGFYSADALIVGGGPTGLAAAIALRQAGADVLVADALEPPIDKACGEGLMPDSRRELALLGIEPDEALGARFIGIRFADLHSAVNAEFTQGKGLGLRRLALHRLLLDRAAALGVRMANLMLWMDRYPLLRRRVLRAFVSRPDLFAAMLRVHLSEETLSAVALRHGPEFGRLLLSSAG